MVKSYSVNINNNCLVNATMAYSTVLCEVSSSIPGSNQMFCKIYKYLFFSLGIPFVQYLCIYYLFEVSGVSSTHYTSSAVFGTLRRCICCVLG